jgi:serine/threonine protein phosphatase PrpC
MKPQVWAVSDKGSKRDSNQDSYLANENLGIFVVADGMGGHSGGEVASSLAVQTVENEIRALKGSPARFRDVIQKVYERASIRIFDKAAIESPELVGMGTTMVGCFLHEKNVFIGNVGDSRCYLYKDQKLWQLTEDHSLLNEQIRSGLLRPEQASTFTGRNVITRSVGYERAVHVDVIEREVVSGETYLLCSDGLSGLVTDEKILQTFKTKSLSEVALALVNLAIAHGGDDNITVLILHFPEKNS